MKVFYSFQWGNVFFHVHVLSLLSATALLCAECSLYAGAVLLCAALHEAGHLAAIFFLGNRITDFTLLPCGAEIRMAMSGYREEALVAAAGPAVNLCCALWFRLFDGPFFLFCADCSLFLALLNLLPLRSFDGGQIVKCLALSKLPYEKALRLRDMAEKIALILFAALCLAVDILCRFNLSMTVILAYLFFAVYTRPYE